MAGPVNPATIEWTAPTKWESGEDFLESHFAGYGFGWRRPGEADFQLTVDVPVTFQQTSLPLADLQLPDGELEIAMRTVAYNGATSVWTPGLPITRDSRVPLPPLLVGAA